VKVFNSSVEKRVENGPVQIQILTGTRLTLFAQIRCSDTRLQKRVFVSSRLFKSFGKKNLPR
jgi:hypothetical protein